MLSKSKSKSKSKTQLTNGLMLVLALVTYLGCSSVFAQTEPNDGFDSILPIDTSIHPEHQMQQSFVMWEEGNKEQSTYLFFIAQIRWRTYLLANPDLPKHEEPMAFGLITQMGLKNIHQWADDDGKYEFVVNVIDKSLNWHAENEDEFTPKSEHDAAHEKVRDGFIKLKAAYKEKS